MCVVQESGYKCRCPPQFSGFNCDGRSCSLCCGITICATQHSTAQHNATQRNATQRNTTQHNVIYSTDLFCSFPAKNPCIPNPCLNEGACKRFGIKPTCACQKGFTGIHCQGIKNNPNVTVEYKMTVERFCFQA